MGVNRKYSIEDNTYEGDLVRNLIQVLKVRQISFRTKEEICEEETEYEGDSTRNLI